MSLASIDAALRRGLGLGAKVIGNTYDVYRLNFGSTGSIVAPNNIAIHNFRARFTLKPPPQLIESEPVYNMWYTSMLDTRRLKIMDVLVETGPTAVVDTPDTGGGRIYTFVGQTTLRAPVFARTEVLGALTRPNDASSVDQPVLGETVEQATNKFNEWLYILNNGLYSVAGSGTPAAIPMGLQPHRRTGPPQEMAKEWPTATSRGIFFIFIPLLPGVFVQPGDMVSDHVGNRYQIEMVHVTTTGLQGYQCIAHSVFI